MKKVRVLVIDDSKLFQQLIAKGLASDPSLEVVGMASDPYEARDKILQLKPDVLTCDIEMPKMSGLEFVSKLMPQFPIPVVIVSSMSRNEVDVMNSGAIDYIQKPQIQAVQSVETFLTELSIKVKIASLVNVSQWKRQNNQKPVIKDAGVEKNHTYQIIAIGSSTGGTQAITHILQMMSASIPGIVVVQHIPPVFSAMFAESLNQSTSFHVKEAVTGDRVEPGKVLIAPGNQHMRIKKVGDQYQVECFQSERVNGHCPSVDVLFESVAKEAKNSAIGILLTGMGSDGAKGLLSMRRQGARTIGQDEESAVVYGMPKVAYEIGAIEKQSSLDGIPPLLNEMLRG